MPLVVTLTLELLDEDPELYPLEPETDPLTPALPSLFLFVTFGNSFFRRLVSSTTPLIRAPFEKVTGIDTFTGRELSDKNNLDFIARNTGLDIFTNQIDKVGKLRQLEELSPTTLATILPSVAREINPEKNITNNQYQQLEELNNYIKQLKNTGVKVRTMNEIQAPMKARLNRIKKARKRYK